MGLGSSLGAGEGKTAAATLCIMLDCTSCLRLEVLMTRLQLTSAAPV
jgi:hypothetical protein